MNDNIAQTGSYVCKECGNSFDRFEYDVRGENVFCSKSCTATFYNRSRKIIKECMECHKSFNPIRGSEGKFCSTDCSHAYKRNALNAKIIAQDGQGFFADTIRTFLIKTRGIRCEICGITEWRGLPLVVIMDHIDGHADNNSLKNLRLICSNCDTTLPTYKARNKGNGRKSRRKFGAIGGT